MHPMAEYYIENAKQQSIEKMEKNLIELGLFEKHYAPDNLPLDIIAYPYFDSKTQKYYKKVAVSLTNEEYEEVMRHAIIKSESKLCGTSSWLIFVAIVIFIVFFILGIDMGKDSVFTFGSESNFSFGTACIFWFIGIINGSMFIALAKIIDLLNKKD